MNTLICKSLALVKIEVELVSNRVILLADLNAHATDLSFSSVVQSAVIEDELHVLHEVLDSRILVFFQLSFNGLEVHWVFDDHWVVWDLQIDIVDWLFEDLRLLVPL